MSQNCIHCVKRKRTSSDLLCDSCRRKDFVLRLNDLAKAGRKPFVEHHIQGRLGPIYEAKPLGFGTNLVMVQIAAQSWIAVAPLMWKIIPSK